MGPRFPCIPRYCIHSLHRAGTPNYSISKHASLVSTYHFGTKGASAVPWYPFGYQGHLFLPPCGITHPSFSRPMPLFVLGQFHPVDRTVNYPIFVDKPENLSYQLSPPVDRTVNYLILVDTLENLSYQLSLPIDRTVNYHFGLIGP